MTRIHSQLRVREVDWLYWHLHITRDWWSGQQVPLTDASVASMAKFVCKSLFVDLVAHKAAIALHRGSEARHVVSTELKATLHSILIYSGGLAANAAEGGY